MATSSLPRGELLRAARERFRRAAWSQRACAVTGDMRDWKDGQKNWEAHHVLEKRELKKLGRQDALWDERNALRLTPDAHRRHTSRMHPVPQSALTDENIEFVFEVMGVRGIEYLGRLYSGSDARVQRASKVVEAEYELEISGKTAE